MKLYPIYQCLLAIIPVHDSDNSLLAKVSFRLPTLWQSSTSLEFTETSISTRIDIIVDFNWLSGVNEDGMPVNTTLARLLYWSKSSKWISKTFTLFSNLLFCGTFGYLLVAFWSQCYPQVSQEPISRDHLGFFLFYFKCYNHVSLHLTDNH